VFCNADPDGRWKSPPAMIFHDRYWEDGSKRTDTDFVHACRDHLSRKREEEIQKAGAKAARMTDLDQLAELWSEPGATLATIGDRLGLSRGQVAGKVDRARRLKGDLRFEPSITVAYFSEL
jgi:hypothetical protein